jgi:uncharacterized protein YodC (DUF2158 family)
MENDKIYLKPGDVVILR